MLRRLGLLCTIALSCAAAPPEPNQKAKIKPFEHTTSAVTRTTVTKTIDMHLGEFSIDPVAMKMRFNVRFLDADGKVVAHPHSFIMNQDGTISSDTGRPTPKGSSALQSTFKKLVSELNDFVLANGGSFQP